MTIVIARLKPKPLAAGQLLCALALAALVLRQARGDTAGEVVRSIFFGDVVMTALMAVAVVGFVYFRRLWRWRNAYVRHDGVTLYRGGSARWPLALVRDVVVVRDGVGVESLQLVVDDDSEVTRELVKLALLDGSPEAVRGGVMFAAAGVRGVPGGVTVN
ncbi:MAG: hypothetical protein ACREB7_12770 [Sphingopyxis sp.]|uniref:hypothetical protein n=1 Tax=Sphingopyxis sp. TaxID=1908224 RepID=UPI003D6D5DD5